jgi:hypothetical protein
MYIMIKAEEQRENREALADFLDTAPGEFDIGTWGIAWESTSSCGTAACLAGWAFILAYPEWREVSWKVWQACEEMTGQEIAEWATAHLGLSDETFYTYMSRAQAIDLLRGKQ